MAESVVGFVVALLFVLLAGWGERVQRWLETRRLDRHTCHTSCSESRWCRCGCRDGLYGSSTGTRCAVCGEGASVGVNDVTHEMPAPRGQTTWGQGHERSERMRLYEWEGRQDAGDE